MFQLFQCVLLDFQSLLRNLLLSVFSSSRDIRFSSKDRASVIFKFIYEMVSNAHMHQLTLSPKSFWTKQGW